MTHTSIVNVDQQLSVASQSLAIEPVAPVPISRDVVSKYNRAMELTQKHDLPVRFMGYAPAFDGVRIHRGQKSDWVVNAIDIDPLYKSGGNTLYVPPAVQENVGRTLRAGVNFDAVYIAHEILPDSVRPGQPVPVELIMPPPPPSTVRYSGDLEAASEAYWQGMLKLMRFPFRATAALASVAVGAAAIAVGGAAVIGAAALTAASLDPILLGLYLDKAWKYNDQYLALWFYLTHWYWPTER